MEATLTIEVPDDFEKGDCYNCGFRQMIWGYDIELDCEDGDCPLEIQKACKTCKNICTALCDNCNVGKFNHYERAEHPIELRKDNK